MNKKDKLQRFLFENIAVRGEIVHLESSYQQIIQQHEYPPFIQRLLGEALVLVTLLAAIIKFKGRLTLQFQGKSGLKLLLVQCNHDFHLRALAQFDNDLSEENLQDSLKNGILVIMMDPDTSTQRYQGVVSWRGNSLTESIEGYFRDSEQLETRIWLALTDKQASGFLLQAMPQESAKGFQLHAPEENRDWEHLIHLTSTITDDELLHLENKILLHRLYVEEDIRLFEEMPVIFQCTCSARRGENAILMLGEKEAEEELNEHQVIVVHCDFCNREFTFDRVDVANIFKHGGTPPPTTQIH
jgi:molecular chaperone Hsp33